MASLLFDVRVADAPDIRKYHFKDIQSPFRTKVNQLGFSENVDYDAIKGSLKNILSWNKGERIINPEFGNPFLPFVYQPLNDTLIGQIQASVKISIEKWEPRITVNNVDITKNEDRNELFISITYTVPSMNKVDVFSVEVA